MPNRIVPAVAITLILALSALSLYEFRQVALLRDHVATLNSLVQQCSNDSASMKALMDTMKSSAKEMQKAPKDKF